MMTLQAIAIPILAQISRWERLGDGLRKTGDRGELYDLLPAVAVLALVGLVSFAVVRWRHRNDMSRRCNDPEKLFRELCLAHNLTGPDRKLLRRLSDAHGCSQPAEVFLRSSAFALAQQSSELAELKPELASLRARLF
ncbi:MAG: hypothetical protein AAF961_06835 [Planctomycetota bacterium]